MDALLDGLPWQVAAVAGIFLCFLAVGTLSRTTPVIGQLRRRKTQQERLRDLILGGAAAALLLIPVGLLYVLRHRAGGTLGPDPWADLVASAGDEDMSIEGFLSIALLFFFATGLAWAVLGAFCELWLQSRHEGNRRKSAVAAAKLIGVWVGALAFLLAAMGVLDKLLRV